jgi:hypothetical protein
MHYTLIANSVDPEQVEERTIDGDRHLVAKNVTFIRPMELAGGYVPEQSVANSVPAWDEQPLTINHPKNLPDRPWYDDDHGGFYVSANDEEVRQRKVIGHAENPSLNDDGSVSADLAHNVERLEAIANGEAVAREDADAATELLEALENGDPFDVSSQYFPQPLPPGEYDGEHREEVEAIANADSIAILPTKPGVCSLEDGCGFKPQQATANADVVRAPVANAGTSDDPTGASSSGSDTTGNASDNPLADVDPADVDDWPADGEPSENTLLELGRRLASTVGLSGASSGDEPAESGTGAEGTPSANGSDPGSDLGSNMKRDELIDEITSNSEIKRESLEGMGDTCLQSTHEHVVANASGDGDEDDDDGQTTNTGGDTLADMSVDDLAGALADQGFVTEDSLEDVVANAQQQSEKEQRVEQIVANSSEYDEDDKSDLMDTPESVLADIEDGLSANATLPGATGAADRASANASGGDDADEYPDGTIGGGV